MRAACAGRRDWNSRRSLKRAVLGGLGLAIVVLAPACSIVDQYVVDTAVIPDKEYPKAAAPPPLYLATYKFPGETDIAYKLVGDASKTAAGNPTKMAAAKLLRNRLTAAMLQRSKHICIYHKAAITANASTANFFAGIAAASLSATAAIVTGGVSTILSTASALTTATRGKFNANFYRSYFAPAIVKEIEILRKDGRQAILSKNDWDTTIYPIDLAVIDVSNYHLTCSFLTGIVALTDRRDKRHLSNQCEIDKEVGNLAEAVDTIAGKKADLDTKQKAEEATKLGNPNYVMVSYTERIQAYENRMRLLNMRILNLHALSLNADKCAKPVKP